MIAAQAQPKTVHVVRFAARRFLFSMRCGARNVHYVRFSRARANRLGARMRAQRAGSLPSRRSIPPQRSPSAAGATALNSVRRKDNLQPLAQLLPAFVRETDRPWNAVLDEPAQLDPARA